MVSRGIRGATTVTENTADEIIYHTKLVLQEMIEANDVTPENVSHVFISATKDIDAVFPARALREFSGWTYVPVMCMAEIEVENSLKNCIRIMMVVNTNQNQAEVKHIFHNEAITLRPELVEKRGQ
ncbi:chorismate mutase [Oceanobacillus alkalisoli]|uniref:chorismate mutase n=1 Tax=Oceanobacillus alkalisoli TaxID=2925113 RepID=UPI001EF05016|nr:chorismate mutase [Oceanobacillus alkalisoli]MCF3941637.1 chorismate mutase [Oceanobacillus alkalisoli]MCG5102919.1 chorismate mutase [Oceanobacillus alkalisoli]